MTYEECVKEGKRLIAKNKYGYYQYFWFSPDNIWRYKLVFSCLGGKLGGLKFDGKRTYWYQTAIDYNKYSSILKGQSALKSSFGQLSNAISSNEWFRSSELPENFDASMSRAQNKNIIMKAKKVNKEYYRNES